jgi:hypothetical protein
MFRFHVHLNYPDRADKLKGALVEVCDRKAKVVIVPDQIAILYTLSADSGLSLCDNESSFPGKTGIYVQKTNPRT